jgi:site-specific DNA-cytosine methylase
MCETWPKPPPLIVLENVPRHRVARASEMLEKAQKLLMNYGYVFHTGTHDCGEIGGLAQHRKRFLLIARRPNDVPAYIYQPPKKRVRACGEVLELPIPAAVRAASSTSCRRFRG